MLCIGSHSRTNTPNAKLLRMNESKGRGAAKFTTIQFCLRLAVDKSSSENLSSFAVTSQRCLASFCSSNFKSLSQSYTNRN